MPNKFKGNLCQGNSAAWRLFLCFLWLIANQEHCMSKVNILIPRSLLEAPLVYSKILRTTCQNDVFIIWMSLFRSADSVSPFVRSLCSQHASTPAHVPDLIWGRDSITCAPWTEDIRPSLSPPLCSWFQSPLTLKHSTLVLFQRCAAGSTWTLSPACVSMEM